MFLSCVVVLLMNRALHFIFFKQEFDIPCVTLSLDQSNLKLFLPQVKIKVLTMW